MASGRYGRREKVGKAEAMTHEATPLNLSGTGTAGRSFRTCLFDALRVPRGGTRQTIARRILCDAAAPVGSLGKHGIYLRSVSWPCFLGGVHANFLALSILLKSSSWDSAWSRENCSVTRRISVLNRNLILSAIYAHRVEETRSSTKTLALYNVL